jgi:DNA-binding CsgD family transcriptional regulator
MVKPSLTLVPRGPRKPSKPPKPSRGRKFKTTERRIEALRLKQDGYSYNDIAEALQISKTLAFNDVNHALSELKTVEVTEATKLRDLELSRIDRLWTAANRKASRGNLGAIAVSIRLSEHRCDLLGLTGKRTAVGGAAGDPAPAPTVPQVSVTVINQQTIIQIQEVMNVAREHGLLDRLLSLPQVQRVEVGPKIEGQHDGNGQPHAGNGNGHSS